ncbi:hypothetical protein BWQ96_05890 [Gracilariopsis chorda]|uniref:Uncharacterized protein n=1 Tax=Gracilariopsis chorda TaxID=448386 RepID=A0A2V3ITC9_9FLOR|nr:hypothetical protein BWQ96_05890 [Gracilariopsis chorda]|eukprot:PXF44370.1 hypothetical protein BWQ96_05890 [Gracilariopsis chorda]
MQIGCIAGAVQQMGGISQVLQAKRDRVLSKTRARGHEAGGKEVLEVSGVEEKKEK